MSGIISKQILNKNILFYFDAANTKSYDGISDTGYSLVLGTTASLLTGVTWSSRNAGVMNFNGTYSIGLATHNIDSWIDCGSRIPIISPNFPITLEAWIKPRKLNGETGVVTQGLFALDSMDQFPGNYYGVDIAVTVNDGSDTMNFGAGYYNGTGYGVSARRSSTTSTRPVICGVWNHVVAVFKGLNDITLYINGDVVSGNLSGSGTSLAWSGGVGKTVIGKTAGYYKYIFDGDISILRAYNEEIDSDGVKTNYNLHAKRFGMELK
jgi:hypothetical protein